MAGWETGFSVMGGCLLFLSVSRKHVPYKCEDPNLNPYKPLKGRHNSVCVCFCSPSDCSKTEGRDGASLAAPGLASLEQTHCAADNEGTLPQIRWQARTDT